MQKNSLNIELDDSLQYQKVPRLGDLGGFEIENKN